MTQAIHGRHVKVGKAICDIEIDTTIYGEADVRGIRVFVAFEDKNGYKGGAQMYKLVKA